MREVIFTNVMYLGNAGDFWSSPFHYYDFSFIKYHKVHFMDISRSGESGFEHFRFKDQLVIIGGGGLITTKGNFLQNTMEYLIENNKVILWGVGSNTFKEIAWDIIFHKNVLLAGVRDTNHLLGLQYLPCVSCKHKIFDKVNDSSSGIGVIEHTRLPSNLPLDTVRNNESLEVLIDFILSKEYIISTTYHGVYWSQLLNKVVAYYSLQDIVNSKITNLRHRVPVCNNDNYQDVLQHASRSVGMLEESRYLNDLFYSKVKDILSAGN